MKKLLIALVSLSLLFISGSSILSNTKDWGTIRQATYAIGSQSDAFCSATKISETELITAAHCMAGSLDGTFTIWNEGKIVGSVIVIKQDNSKDLALLYIVSGVEGPYASVASQEPLQDTSVVLAGYPLNLGEVLTEGVLQGSKIDSGAQYYLTTAPGTFGSSGGGLWVYRSWYGWELVGVASFMAIQDWYYGPIPYNSVTFHVSLEEIQKFLKTEYSAE
jgi:S1-C subfamily serine protease